MVECDSLGAESVDSSVGCGTGSNHANDFTSGKRWGKY